MYGPAVICGNGFCKNMHLQSKCMLCVAGCGAVGNEPLKLGTRIAVMKIVMNIALKELRLYCCLQVSNNKHGSGTKLHGCVSKFNVDIFRS